MGKQRFRLSHMIPNAWFYRLRDMNKKAISTSKQLKIQPRNSFCYTPKVYTSPTNKKLPSSKHVLGSIYIQPTHADQDLFLSPSSSSYYESPLNEATKSLDGRPSTTCCCGVISSSSTDVKIEFSERSYTSKKIQDSSGGYEFNHEIIELQMPPKIVTKSKRDDTSTNIVKKNEESCSQSSISIKIVKETTWKKPVSRFKIRSNSTEKKVCRRSVRDQKKLSSSCCIVKSTFDPRKDLRESMMDIIAENNIRSSKDLEKLLACYLSLNSNEYHDMIIKAFEEIWLTLDFVGR